MTYQDELIQKARTSLLHFIVYMFPAYEIAPHHRLICKEVQEAIDTPNGRLIISCPPRHGKSFIISEFMPAFYYGYKGIKREVIATSYAASLSDGFGKKIRAIMSSEAYKRLFPDTYITDKANKGTEIDISMGSTYRAVGRGGGITGKGCNLLIIDDLLKDSVEANSATIREVCKSWFTSTANSRIMPGGSVILVMTRWHEDDLPGWLISKQRSKWKIINLEALCENPDKDPLGRKQGEALWESWHSKSKLLEIKELDPYTFSALYQGNPTASTGNLFESNWLDFYEDSEAKNFDRVVISCDTSSTTKETSSYNAILVFGIKDSKAYLIDVIHERMKFPSLLEKITKTCQTYKADYLLIENASSGTQLIQMYEVEKPYKHTQVIPISKQANKVEKFKNHLNILSDGKLLLPQSVKSWKEDFINELLGYPFSSFTDSVVALTHFIAWWQVETNFFSKPFRKKNTLVNLFKVGRGRLTKFSLGKLRKNFKEVI